MSNDMLREFHEYAVAAGRNGLTGGWVGTQERREDPVIAHRMRLDGYSEARALAHEAAELLRGDAAASEVAMLMLARAKDLLQPEPK